MNYRNQWFLAVYSGVLTLVFVVSVFCRFAAPRNQSFDQITAHRINIVEPDGTLRLVLSNRAEFPGIFLKGREHPHPGRVEAAGLLFFNDEATEQGGLVWNGYKDKDGKVQNHGHLSFDQYESDQIFDVDVTQEGAEKSSVINFAESGGSSLKEIFDAEARIIRLPKGQQAAEWKKYWSTHPGIVKRIILGRTSDKSAVLRMKDVEGRDRLVLRVDVNGTPLIQMLDANGKVTNQIPAQSH